MAKPLQKFWISQVAELRCCGFAKYPSLKELRSSDRHKFNDSALQSGHTAVKETDLNWRTLFHPTKNICGNESPMPTSNRIILKHKCQTLKSTGLGKNGYGCMLK